MKLIGLTGGAGSGKSTVSAMLRELGATVVDADEAAHAVYEPGCPGFDQVVAAFGPDYLRDGRVDRARLGALVFNDSAARRRLNAIVHPLVRDWMAARTIEAAGWGVEVVVQDVPLLYENELEHLYSSVLLVYVPERLQLKRLAGRGIAQDIARAMIASQMPIEEKRSRADHLIDNSGTKEATLRRVAEVWKAVLKL